MRIGIWTGIIVFVGTVAGLLLSAFMMWVAWNHNPQGEIHTPEGIDWGYWLLIGLSWFPVGFTLAVALQSVIILIVQSHNS